MLIGMEKFLIKYGQPARKLHRYLVVFSIISFLVMAVTGLFIKYRWLVSQTKIGSVWKLGQVIITETDIRKLHSDYSVYLTIIIGLMMVTGLAMYLLPKVIAWNRKNQAKKVDF